MKSLVFLSLFSVSVWGVEELDIPEAEIMKAAAHTVLVAGDSGFCHGILISFWKVLTAAHCVSGEGGNNLRVMIYTGSDYADSLIQRNSFKEIKKIKDLMVKCLKVLTHSQQSTGCLRYFKSFINRDYSQTLIVDGKPNSRGFITVYPAKAVHIHPDYDRGTNESEDTAVITFTGKAPVFVHFEAFSKNHFNEKKAFPSYEPLDDTFDPLSHLDFLVDLAGVLRKPNYPPIPLGCFSMDWRSPNFVYQKTQAVTFEVHANLLNEDIKSWISGWEELYPMNGPLFQNDREKEAFVIGEYKRLMDLSIDERFTPYRVITDFNFDGYSGGPIWCYSPEKGLLLKGYLLAGATYRRNTVFVRNFDEDIYQWIKQKK